LTRWQNLILVPIWENKKALSQNKGGGGFMANGFPFFFILSALSAATTSDRPIFRVSFWPVFVFWVILHI
jgi:hypothetical protein